MVEIGEYVEVSDENRQLHDALVTAIHGWTTVAQRAAFCDMQIGIVKERMDAPGQTDEGRRRDQEFIDSYERQKSAEPFVPSCINVVYVSSDPSKHDPYGQQLERLSSLQHESQVQNMTVPGRFYREHK
jgi:hypothetical protein